jgi:hypothetical protein
LTTPLTFLRYCENELLLLILDADTVFYKFGVAIVNALLISRVVFLFFLFVEQLVFCKSINAYKKSFALNFFDFYFDFDFEFDFFFVLEGWNEEFAGFFFSP